MEFFNRFFLFSPFLIWLVLIKNIFFSIVGVPDIINISIPYSIDMKKILITLGFLFFIGNLLFSQVIITSDSTANSLAQALAGPGVIVSNAKLTGGGYNNSGTFKAQNSNFHIKKGIVLSTGKVDSIPGSVNKNSTNSNCMWCNQTDPDLEQLIKKGSHTPPLRDVVILEFDVFVTADTLRFNYIFASEEYPDFVCTAFNDVFGFFISGPGISGNYSNNSKNLAIVPGTTLPVAINSINSGIKGLQGNDSLCISLNHANLYRTNSDTVNSITYNGSTVLLSAVAAVKPCNTYRLKLIIGDVGDNFFDSGVFLEAGSLISSGIKMEASTAAGAGYKDIVEGCNEGILKLTRAVGDTFPLVVDLEYGGTAARNVDYNTLPAQVTIPKNQRSTFLNIPAIKDNLSEGTETITVYVLDPCFKKRIDSIVFTIIDDISLTVSADKIICEGETVGIWAEGAVEYTWSPASTLSNHKIKDPLAAPVTTTTYIVKGEVALCTKFDSVKVTVNAAPIVNTSNDTAICSGEAVTLFAEGAISYNWSPATGLSNPNIADPVATPAVSTQYHLVATGINGCTTTKNVLVTVNHPNIVVSADTIICEGNSAILTATGGIDYQWLPATSLSDPNQNTTNATPEFTTTFSVTTIDANGCTASAEVLVEVAPKLEIDLGNDTTICRGKVLVLDAGISNLKYKWNNGANTKSIMISSAGSYTVTVIGAYNCTATDTIQVQLENCDSKIFVPTAFSPNGDGYNDELLLYEMGGHTFKELKIFNRWGNMIFESKNLNTSWGGDEIESGVYIYLLNYYDEEGFEMTAKGNITVIK